MDREVRTCARDHADQHVVEMIFENTRMLCTVVNQFGGCAPYRLITHMLHPVGGFPVKLEMALQAIPGINEYRYRYRKTLDHKSASVIKTLLQPRIDNIGLKEFAYALHEVYRIPRDAVKAYRLFYINERSRFAKWSRRKEPGWYRNGTN